MKQKQPKRPKGKQLLAPKTAKKRKTLLQIKLIHKIKMTKKKFLKRQKKQKKLRRKKIKIKTPKSQKQKNKNKHKGVEKLNKLLELGPQGIRKQLRKLNLMNQRKKHLKPRMMMLIKRLAFQLLLLLQLKRQKKMMILTTDTFFLIDYSNSLKRSSQSTNHLIQFFLVTSAS